MIRLALLVACCSAVVSAQAGFNGPGRYEIVSVKSGKVIDLDRNDQTTVIQFSSRGTDNQTWEVRPAGGGFFFLRNGMNGYALDSGGGRNSEPLRGVPFNGNASQQWRLEQGKDGNALIISRSGATIDVPDGTDRDGAHLQMYQPNGDSNQRFSFRRVAAGRAGWTDDSPLAGGVITCSSNSGDRVYCNADTRNGVELSRQLSGSPCRQGSTWGFDNRGIWVDRGCRAEFTLSAGRDNSDAPTTRRDIDRRSQNTTVCESNNGQRVRCDMDTLGRAPQLVRQISGSPCRQGETWGWDRRGVWVDRGCRAEFAPGR